MEEEVLCNSDPSELIGSTSNQNLEPSLSGSIDDNTGSADERSEHSFSSNSDNKGNSDKYSDGEAEALVDMYGEQDENWAPLHDELCPKPREIKGALLTALTCSPLSLLLGRNLKNAPGCAKLFSVCCHVDPFIFIGHRANRHKQYWKTIGTVKRPPGIRQAEHLMWGMLFDIACGADPVCAFLLMLQTAQRIQPDTGNGGWLPILRTPKQHASTCMLLSGPSTLPASSSDATMLDTVVKEVQNGVQPRVEGV
ncbi:hypothetical protein H0H81_000421 [Sphagnurus paluster]|uniref:Uncharacterized protein n=1 Tax=Sphagnurus paluster TaxID=117069 RepID=A0A9P7KK10_9AGAR|nr:hypothetical protein H0H81_000421 [Sphagnurus paluster]